MKLAFITPTAYLERFSKQGDIYLCLAHLIDDEGKNSYTSFHRREAQKGRTVILDNGLFEGAQVPSSVLLHRARLVGAQVVCAPDVLYDSQGTIKAFKQFIKDKQDVGLVARVMGIPQADNPTDWWECYRFMELSSDCSLIGLSILSIPQSFEKSVRPENRITDTRMHVIRQLHTFQDLVGRRVTQCHLLGLGESYADVMLASRLLPDTIVSNDSTSCFVHGIQDQIYNRFGVLPYGKDLKRLDFTIDKLTEKQEADVQKNITIAKDIRSRNWNGIRR